MRIQEWKSHPDFPVGRECMIRGCWEFELGPGEATIAHQHDDGQEIDIIIEGRGQITVGELTRDVQAGDVIFVPAGVRHMISNDGSPTLRGITVENLSSNTAIDSSGEKNPSESTSGEGNEVSMQDLEELIEAIPEDLDVSNSLQMIIRLFDLAGYLSEQIDESLGLDNEAGYTALKHIEHRVMDAVIEISNRYQFSEGYMPFPHPRF